MWGREGSGRRRKFTLMQMDRVEVGVGFGDGVEQCLGLAWVGVAA